MITNTTSINRLGNRKNNQDRCLVIHKQHTSLLAVADGMGGHPRGELAAQVAVDTLREHFEQQGSVISDPAGFLRKAIHSAHLSILTTGNAENPPVNPRTVCIACVIQGNQMWWAHVGDSRLYLLRDGNVVQQTQDHTPLQELLARGEISKEDARQHPMRHNVSRCLGGSSNLPKVTLSSTVLQKNDTIVLCSDGLWAALTEQQLLSLGDAYDLESAANKLAEDAESTSYPHSDNISLVALRWIAGSGAGKPNTSTISPPTNRNSTESSDPVQQAIDDINRAIIDYASEIKKI